MNKNWCVEHWLPRVHKWAWPPTHSNTSHHTALKDKLDGNMQIIEGIWMLMSRLHHGISLISLLRVRVEITSHKEIETQRRVDQDKLEKVADGVICWYITTMRDCSWELLVIYLWGMEVPLITQFKGTCIIQKIPNGFYILCKGYYWLKWTKGLLQRLLIPQALGN